VKDRWGGENKVRRRNEKKSKGGQGNRIAAGRGANIAKRNVIKREIAIKGKKKEREEGGEGRRKIRRGEGREGEKGRKKGRRMKEGGRRGGKRRKIGRKKGICVEREERRKRKKR